MDSADLLLSGVMGSVVRCVKPVLIHPTEPMCSWPSPGDPGRVVGLVQEESEVRVLVRMYDSPEDWQELTYSRFNECFAVDASRRRFKPLLR